MSDDKIKNNREDAYSKEFEKLSELNLNGETNLNEETLKKFENKIKPSKLEVVSESDANEV